MYSMQYRDWSFQIRINSGFSRIEFYFFLSVTKKKRMFHSGQKRIVRGEMVFFFFYCWWMGMLILNQICDFFFVSVQYILMCSTICRDCREKYNFFKKIVAQFSVLNLKNEKIKRKRN